MRHVLYTMGKALGLTLLALALAFAGLVAFGSTALGRRTLAHEVNRILAGNFRGSIAVERIDHLRFVGVDGARVVVRDADGRTVLEVDGLAARLKVGPLLRALATRKGPLPIAVTGARVELVDATLIRGSDGQPTIVHAFDPAHPAPPQPRPSRGVRLEIRDARIARIRAHGQAGPIEDLDAVVMGLAASLVHDGTTLVADVAPVTMEVRGLLPQAPLLRGAFEGHLRSMPGAPRSGNASLDARAGDVDLRLRAALSGDELDANFDARAGGGTASGRATGSIGAHKSIDASVVIDSVDPHRIIASAPETAVSATVRARAQVSDTGAASGEATVETAPMRLGGQEVPPITATGRLTPDRVLELEARAHARSARLSLLGARPAVALANGADVDVTARADLAARTVEATAFVELAGIHLANGSVRLLLLRGHAEGPVESPALRATLHAEDVVVARTAIERVDVEASGSTRRPSLSVVARSRGLDLRARAALPLGAELGADGIWVEASRGAARATVTVDRMRIGRGSVDVTGATVRGTGAPIDGRAHLDEREVTVRIDAPGIEVERVAELAGQPGLLAGQASLDLDVHASRQGATGHARARIHATSPRRTSQASDVDLELSFEGAGVAGGLAVAYGPSRVDLRRIDVRADGPTTAAASWRRATGTVDFGATLDLGSLQPLLPVGAVPLDEMAGTVTLTGHAARRRASDLPEAEAEVSTRGLVLAKMSRAIRGVDVRLRASLEGASRRVALDGSLVDKKGQLLAVRLETRAPVGRAARTMPALEGVPVTLHAQLSERELSELPPPARAPGLRGRAEGTLDVTGRIDDPRVALHARVAGLESGASRAGAPMEAAIEGTYDGSKGELRVDGARADRPGAPVIAARAHVNARAFDLLQRGADAAWTAGATLALTDFPIDAVPALASRHVAGLATGNLKVDGLHRDASLDADIRVSRPKLGRETFDTLTLRAHVDRSSLGADVRLERPGSLLAASAKAPARWGADLVPSLDPRGPVDATLQARAFRAAALMPALLGSALHALDGRVDADVHLHAQPDFQSGSADGKVVLSEGRFDSPLAGGSFHDVGAQLSVDPSGTVRLDGVTARGLTGRLTASGTAQLDGLRLREARLALDIPRGDRIPVALQGVALGRVSGHLDVEARMSPDRTTLEATANVPKLEVSLPTSTGHPVQSLDPAHGVVVGAREPNGRFIAIPLQAPRKPPSSEALKLHVVVRLGDNVWIKRDTSLAVRLTGEPVVDVGDTTRISGTVHVTSGQLDVFGKRFTIREDSTVAFTGDPSNPQLVITAVYDAPDKTRIYADVVGTPSHLKVTVRSDPPQPQDAILSLLLFGSPEGLGGTPPPGQQAGSAQQAAGLASGVVTQGINKALSGITSLEISTRLDTSEAANPRPEVDVRVSNTVTTRVTVNTGMPAPGESPDRTFLTIGWTFAPRWLLESTVGDQGSTLFDVLWRHRY